MSTATNDTGIVYVRGIEFEANHGYTAAERKATRRFRLSLEIHAPLDKAARTDRLSDTIDYRRVCEVVMELGTKRTFKLLEALAGSIGRAIRELYPLAARIVIDLEKLAPPCPGVPESCGVRIVVE